MLIETDDGKILACPLDMLIILKLPTGRYYVAFYEERPFPGPVPPADEVDVVRLKSKMHHTTGAASFEESLSQLATLREKLVIDDANVFTGGAIPQDDPIGVLITSNWRKPGTTLEQSLTRAGLLNLEQVEVTK